MVKVRVFLRDSTTGQEVPVVEYMVDTEEQALTKARSRYRAFLQRMETHTWRLETEIVARLG